jgi:Family of unknown function (DUF6476)
MLRRDPMRALTVLVIVMGVVIVIGFGIVAAVIAGRLAERERAAAPRGFAGSAINIPRGARIEAMTADANRLVVDLALPDGGRRIIVIDLATGTRLGTIELRATP